MSKRNRPKLRGDFSSEPLGFEIECDCCGDLAGKGIVYDGDALLCGCAGWISVDSEGNADALTGDAPCPPDARCNSRCV